ncbi:phosphoethanolamine N-methyltransferase 3-like [Mizuhopecten yessoensis]|uniref:phosphoethanolamine N-methyltransferase n=1 Tax=Mizuhopecten yessoensis TaxID=6573 RepID=A0A210PLI2_MIZYE|nr:phosphoethanolamine N-methyltransferase 3-like [Mizuhopecten yessoensis]OWF37358.1 Phosphoethanolamine N-methyltransferase 3 [Mizuhopecten yessoensis]
MSAVTSIMSIIVVACLVILVSSDELFTSKVDSEADGRIRDVYFNKDDQYQCSDHKLPVNDSYIVQFDSLSNVNNAYHVLLLGCSEPYHIEREGALNCRKVCRSAEKIQFTLPGRVRDQGNVVDAVSGTGYTPQHGTEDKEDLTEVRELLVYGTDPHLQIQTGNGSVKTTDVSETAELLKDPSLTVDTEKINTDGTKTSMKEYWDEHSKDASMQEMMLDNDAEELSKDELPEILSYLPKYDNLDVVELGAGIGRFTTHLAQKAGKVLAVDFMENFIEKNREINKNLTNIDYLAADVMDMELNADEWDLVFSNWLYMYLDNDELTHFLRNSLSWLRTDGYMFCRESCLQQSGSKVRTINPTYYRDPLVYESLFASVTIPTEDGRAFYGFEKVFSKSVDTYIKVKNNDNQLVWLIQKVRREYDTSKDFAILPQLKEQRKLETCHILRREELVGRGFVKTGGLEIAKMKAEMLNLQPGQRVLDFSCETGGFGIYIAKTYGVAVVASDSSSTLVHIGRERAKEAGMAQDVQFEVASITRRIHNPDTFDVIYSRDVIGENKNVLTVLRRLYESMKAGGRLLMSEYCIDDDMEDLDLDNDVFDEELDHNSNVPNKVLSTGALIDMMKEAGFIKVSAIDKTDDILRALERELLLVKEQSDAECADTLTVRRKIVNKLKSGDSWMIFYGEKQLS